MHLPVCGTSAAQAEMGVLLNSMALQYGLLASTSAQLYVPTLYCSALGRATPIGAKLQLLHVGVEPEHILSTLAPMAKEEIAVLTNDRVLGWEGGTPRDHSPHINAK